MDNANELGIRDRMEIVMKSPMIFVMGDRALADSGRIAGIRIVNTSRPEQGRSR